MKQNTQPATDSTTQSGSRRKFFGSAAAAGTAATLGFPAIVRAQGAITLRF